MSDFAVVLRAVSLALLGLAAGAMARFYVSIQRRHIRGMPWWAMLAIGCWIIALASATIENFSNDHFEWFQTPFIIAGAAFCLLGVKPYLTLRRTRD